MILANLSRASREFLRPEEEREEEREEEGKKTRAAGHHRFSPSIPREAGTQR